MQIQFKEVRKMFNDEGEKICGRYTVMYEGYLFDGDAEEGLNMFDTDSWQEVSELINAYGDLINVRDNEYDVLWANGEWY